MKEIYIFYSCDEWKSISSMKLIMASTSKFKIIRDLKKELQSDNMELDLPIKELNKVEIERINNNLTYGFIKIVSDGEKQ
jgi:hypothetical protein